ATFYRDFGIYGIVVTKQFVSSVVYYTNKATCDGCAVFHRTSLTWHVTTKRACDIYAPPTHRPCPRPRGSNTKQSPEGRAESANHPYAKSLAIGVPFSRRLVDWRRARAA